MMAIGPTFYEPMLSTTFTLIRNLYQKSRFMVIIAIFIYLRFQAFNEYLSALGITGIL